MSDRSPSAAPRSPLLVGDRVGDRRRPGREGNVVKAVYRSRRWIYFVKWDEFDHESGEYGLRKLELIRDV